MSDSTNKAAFPDEQKGDGSFDRQESAFRNAVGPDTNFPAEAGRYHLYVSMACPWAHRIIIARHLLGLEGALDMTVVDPIRDARGWAFREGEGHSKDPVNDFAFLAEAYTATDASFEGRVTVPVLWDKQTKRIVNNESSELLRILNGPLAALGTRTIDLYPADLRSAIDAVNAKVYDDVNNGVYKAGFATKQPAYESAVRALFQTMGELDARLADQRYLVDGRLTEADIRLFTTLVRFDAVYHGHFKCNLRRIADFPHLAPYLRDLYQTAGFGETTDFDHIKRHYYLTNNSINPTGIVPLGPELDLKAPHDRARLGG